MDDETQQPDDFLPSPSDEQARPTPNPTPDMEAETPAAGAVPPGYDWPTHGGYLGCLLGMMPACLIGGFLGSTFVAWLNAARIVPPVVAGLMVVALFIGCAIGFGRIGWLLGRRFYRKYPREELSWGEDDRALSASRAEHPAQAPDVQ